MYNRIVTINSNFSATYKSIVSVVLTFSWNWFLLIYKIDHNTTLWDALMCMNILWAEKAKQVGIWSIVLSRLVCEYEKSSSGLTRTTVDLVLRKNWCKCHRLTNPVSRAEMHSTHQGLKHLQTEILKYRVWKLIKEMNEMCKNSIMILLRTPSWIIIHVISFWFFFDSWSFSYLYLRRKASFKW